MLEALIDLRRSGTTKEINRSEKPSKKCGDIIVVKKSPAIWGKKEKEYFLIVYLQDDKLEANMGKNLQVHPYSIYKAEETPLGESENYLATRSKYKVDINMFDGSPGLDEKVEIGAIQPTKDKDGEPVYEKSYLTISDLILDETDRTKTLEAKE